MSPALLLSLLTLASADLGSPHGAVFEMQGEITAVKGDPEQTRKRFTATLLLLQPDGQRPVMYWVVAEDGHDGWPWPERIGRVKLDEHLRATGSDAPSLLYEHREGRAIVRLVAPIFFQTDRLEPGNSWREGSMAAEVKSARDGQAIVEYRIPIGHKRTLWIDTETGRIEKIYETVFMGPGKEHKLRYELKGVRPKSKEEAARQTAAFDALLALRDRISPKRRTVAADWDAEQRRALQMQLPRLLEATAGTLVAPVAMRAAKDADFQDSVAISLDALTKRYQGMLAPPFRLRPLKSSEQPLTRKDLQDKVTVLHFWTYQDKPLIEPYGQVGYVDFLHRRRKKDDVNVYGVAVDDRLGNPSKEQAMLDGVKRLRRFMNLGYPQLVDDGGVLEQFGDPRLVGAKLPLTVVIGREGRIRHWHAGLYEVDDRRGLRELGIEVTRALRGRE